MDGLPAWVGHDGYPLSWRHFVYGLQYIRRRNARKQLTHAAAARVAKLDNDTYQSWRAKMDAHAGL